MSDAHQPQLESLVFLKPDGTLYAALGGTPFITFGGCNCEACIMDRVEEWTRDPETHKSYGEHDFSSLRRVPHPKGVIDAHTIGG